MQVKIVRRWGSHQPGEVVDVDQQMGSWLVDNSFGEAEGFQPANARAAAPGTDGPDYRAGGDPTRHRMVAEVKDKGVRAGERGAGVAGRPKRAGDVTHVAPENLGSRGSVEVDEDGARVRDDEGKVTWSTAHASHGLKRRAAERKQGEVSSDPAEDGPQASGEPPAEGESVNSAAADAPQASGESQPEEKPGPLGRLLTQKRKGE